MRLSKAVEIFGSMKAVAEALELSPSTVGDWKKKDGQIPERYLTKLKILMQDREPAVDLKMSFDQALSHFGSVQEIARVAEVHPKTAYFWRDSGNIPASSARKIRQRVQLTPACH